MLNDVPTLNNAQRNIEPLTQRTSQNFTEPSVRFIFLGKASTLCYIYCYLFIVTYLLLGIIFSTFLHETGFSHSASNIHVTWLCGPSYRNVQKFLSDMLGLSSSSSFNGVAGIKTPLNFYFLPGVTSQST